MPLTVSCFSKIQIGLTFLVPAHPGSPGQRAVKRVCVGGGGWYGYLSGARCRLAYGPVDATGPLNESVCVQQTEPLDLSVVRPRSSDARQVKSALGYPCSQCTYVSKRASDLRRHQLVHCSSKRYRCPYCVGERSYKLQFDLGRHMAKVRAVNCFRCRYFYCVVEIRDSYYACI